MLPCSSCSFPRHKNASAWRRFTGIETCQKNGLICFQPARAAHRRPGPHYGSTALVKSCDNSRAPTPHTHLHSLTVPLPRHGAKTRNGVLLELLLPTPIRPIHAGGTHVLGQQRQAWAEPPSRRPSVLQCGWTRPLLIKEHVALAATRLTGCCFPLCSVDVDGQVPHAAPFFASGEAQSSILSAAGYCASSFATLQHAPPSSCLGSAIIWLTPSQRCY